MHNVEWYALYVKPRFERVAAFHLQSRNIEEYLPLRKVTRQLATGTRSIELPLLPGYVFCKTHAPMRCSLLNIPGVLRIAASGISDQKINAIKRTIQTGLKVQEWQFTPTGKTVTVQNGALESITGILDSTASDAQVFVISIDAIGRSIGVPIDDQYSFSFGADSAA
jgi:transcription antitermination factor NusG